MSQRTFSSFLTPYHDYIRRLAESMEKLVAPLEIIGGEFRVDHELFKSLFKAISHILNNMIVHGIETPDERLLKNKVEQGKICISISEEYPYVLIEISDDGRGIQPDALKNRLIQLGLFTSSSVALLTEDELLQMIFLDQFSTAREANLLSGRGVGLSAVKEVVEKMDGSICVSSKEDEGTLFQIRLKLEEGLD